MARRQRIANLLPDEAEAVVRFWGEAGFDETHPVEALAACVDPEEEGAWVRQALDTFGDCGRVLRDDDEIIAYAKYAPPELFGARGGGLATRVSGDAVLLAGLCVAPGLAGRGFARVLLEAVERDLFKRGIRAVEAFCRPDELRGRPTASRPLDFYERKGFRVRSPGPPAPLARLELRSIVSWSENLEAVLEGLLVVGAARLARPADAPTGT